MVLGEFLDWATDLFRTMDKDDADAFWNDLTIEEKKECIEVYQVYKEDVEGDCDPTWVPGVWQERRTGEDRRDNEDSNQQGDGDDGISIKS